MAKISRLDDNVQAFAVDALSNERTIFGTTTTGDDTLDNNVNADFLRGWGIVGPSDEPTREDFNALGFVLGQFIAYLHQVGLPEWNGNQEYHQYSMANEDGSIYVCKTDDHVSVTAPSADTTNWEPLLTALKTFYDNSDSGLTADNVKDAIDELADDQTPQTQTVWNAGTSTTESIISPLKLDTKIKTLAIGEGQTWQDFAASRALNVTYTNTTGRTISVHVALGNGTNTQNTAEMVIDGTLIMPGSSFTNNGTVTTFVTALIPDGATYLLRGTAGTPSLYKWNELREV